MGLTTVVPIRWRLPWICARPWQQSATTCCRARRRAMPSESSCAEATGTCAGSTTLPPRRTGVDASCCAANNLDGTLDEVRKLLDKAVLEERKELARALDDDARFNEMRIEELPPSTAQAVQDLADYNWRSEQARADYEKIRDLLGREVLDQRFSGMKQALEGATDEDREQIRQMLADLNQLLDAHFSGCRHCGAVCGVHGQARAVFPGQPAQRRGTSGFFGAARGGCTTIAELASRRSSVTSWMRWRSRRSVIRA